MDSGVKDDWVSCFQCRISDVWVGWRGWDAWMDGWMVDSRAIRDIKLG